MSIIKHEVKTSDLDAKTHYTGADTHNNDYTLTDLTVRWDVAIHLFELGVEKIVPKILGLSFHSWRTEITDDPRRDAVHQEMILLIPHPKIEGSLLDQDGHTWATEVDLKHTEGLALHYIEINAKNRSVLFQFYPDQSDN